MTQVAIQPILRSLETPPILSLVGVEVLPDLENNDIADLLDQNLQHNYLRLPRNEVQALALASTRLRLWQDLPRYRPLHKGTCFSSVLLGLASGALIATTIGLAVLRSFIP